LLLTATDVTRSQPAFSLQQLFALLAGHKRLHTSYTEQKFVTGVQGAIESSGELLFEAPARMVKRTLRPVTETLAIDGNQAMVERDGRQHTVTLDDHPEIAVHVEGLRACLAGDLDTLLRIYRASLTGTAAHWKLTLVPRDAQAATQVLAITLGGEQADIRSVQVLMSNGDRALTRMAAPRRGD